LFHPDCLNIFGGRTNGEFVTPRRATWAGAAASAVAVATSGCSGVVLQAPRFVVDVVPAGVQVDIVSRDSLVPTGETVVVIRNQSDRSVRVLLLKDAPPIEQLPADVLSAASPLDSHYVVAASNTVKKRKDELASGGLGYRIYQTAFHVHFAPDHRYSVVAIAGDRVDGIRVQAGQRP
jgi:hypothetical protein